MVSRVIFATWGVAITFGSASNDLAQDLLCVFVR
jgi:hypothetical protein